MTLSITGTDVCLAARELIGTPYLHQGRKAGMGIDCIGVPIVVADRLGLGNFDRLDYSKTPDGTLLDKIAEVCNSSVILSPGVLLVFKIKFVPQHCAIVSNYSRLLGKNTISQNATYKESNTLGIIHAWDVVGKVVEHQLTSDWMNRIVGCYGFPGVKYD